MAKKQVLDKDEKFEKQDIDLFEILKRLDTKDYNYYDSLTEEQKKKFVPYMLTHWMSCIKGPEELSQYYVLSTNEFANKHLFNEMVQKHPKLQYLMLCVSSPNFGKQFHQYIPHINNNVSKLKSVAKTKDIKEFYKKIYPKTDEQTLDEFSECFVESQKRKVYLGTLFPNMKIQDIEVLNQVITDEDIVQYEKDRGN